MLIEAVGTRAWVCHQCDPIDSIVSQPFHGALKQLTSNTHTVKDRFNKQSRNERSIGNDRETYSGHLVVAFADPSATLANLFDQKAAVEQMNLVWVDSILGYREADVVKCTDVTLSHRTVF